jgi:AGZA family xanthine/uracil permease-like MFS transporter
MVDRQIGRSALVLAICGVLSLFGVMHSVLPTGGIYLPWSASLRGSHAPWHWAAAYLAFALMVVVFGFAAAATRDDEETPAAA